MEDWLVEGGGGTFSIFLGVFLRQAEEIRALVPKTQRLERRRIKQAARWQRHPQDAHHRIEGWEQRFADLLARALRQRNATVHGTQTVPEVVATVDGFIARVAAIVVAQAVESTTDGTTLVDALETGRTRSRRILWRLAQDEGPSAEVLFTP